jgi:hypothetical protein
MVVEKPTAFGPLLDQILLETKGSNLVSDIAFSIIQRWQPGFQQKTVWTSGRCHVSADRCQEMVEFATTDVRHEHGRDHGVGAWQGTSLGTTHLRPA